MLFTSFVFIVFFAVTWALWYTFSSFRRLILLLASLLFISSFSWVSAGLCVLLALINFSGGKRIIKRRERTIYFGLQFLNIALIPAGNYLSGQALFFAGSGTPEMSRLFIAVGLSFYGLQHYAYINDLYSKRIAPEKDVVDFLVGSTYFLKFLSGPLTLYQQLKDSLLQQEHVSVKPFPAMNRILIGYFKKMVLADALSPSVSSVFDYGDPLPGITILAAAILFSIQLYFDFSGYCDIAIGCSLLFGITLPENFNMPFRALNMTSFWRRWHITLLGFFTKYVFYPFTFLLRGKGKYASAIGVIAVFLLSAVWHGLGATFMVWGLCHALFVLVELYLPRGNDGHRIFKRMAGPLLVLFLFSFSNIFFRSGSWPVCERLLGQLFDAGNFFPEEWAPEFLAPLAVGGHQIDQFNFYLLLVFIGMFIGFENRFVVLGKHERFRPVHAFLLLTAIFVFGVFASGQRFIYMQF